MCNRRFLFDLVTFRNSFEARASGEANIRWHNLIRRSNGFCELLLDIGITPLSKSMRGREVIHVLSATYWIVSNQLIAAIEGLSICKLCCNENIDSSISQIARRGIFLTYELGQNAEFCTSWIMILDHCPIL